MLPAQIGVSATVRRRVAEVTPTFNHLLWRAAANTELEPPIANEVGRARVLDHVERIFVPHVDDARPDLDAARSGADGGKQWEGRRKLPGKVVHAKVCPIRTEFLRRHGKFD